MRLYRTLRGDEVEPTFSWLIGRVCEGFGIGTLEAMRQLEEEPAGLSWQILDDRAFARVYAEREEARKNPKATVEYGPEWELADEIEQLAEAEMVAERKARKKGG